MTRDSGLIARSAKGKYINVYFCWQNNGSEPPSFTHNLTINGQNVTRTIHNIPVELEDPSTVFHSEPWKRAEYDYRRCGYCPLRCVCQVYEREISSAGQDSFRAIPEEVLVKKFKAWLLDHG